MNPVPHVSKKKNVAALNFPVNTNYKQNAIIFVLFVKSMEKS